MSLLSLSPSREYHLGLSACKFWASLSWYELVRVMGVSTHRPPYRYMLGQLKAARRAARLTQEQVAGRLGVTQAFVSKVERGERRIDPVELSEFAALYEQDREYFLLTPVLRPGAPQAKTVELSPDDVGVLERLAYERGESEEELVRQAVRAFAGSRDPSLES